MKKAPCCRTDPPFGHGPDSRCEKQRAADSGGVLFVLFTVCIHNCPDIADVRTALAILESLGCKARREGSTLCIDPTGLDRHCVEPRLAGKMRSSVLFLGALLARFSQAELALPGGCPLGDRPIDLHVKALSQLGVRFCFEEGRMRAVWHKRLDGDIRLPLPSVGATENLLLACALGKRTVNITGAAREPEIADLIGFLRAAGADISGAGTSSLQICGVSRLHGATYTILPDRIETATYSAWQQAAAARQSFCAATQGCCCR